MTPTTDASAAERLPGSPIDPYALSRSAEELAPLPASTTRLISLIAREDTGVAEIVEVISLDQALTAALLRTANSAALGASKRVGVIQEALQRLGTGSVLTLAVGMRVRDQMAQPLPEYELEEGELWRHSVATAVAAELVARQSRVAIPREAFTAALLHDVGKLVLARYLDAETLRWLRRARNEGRLDRPSSEAEILGVHHGEIGQIVGQHWRLPDAIAHGIAFHHTPDRAADPVTDTVHVADVVAKRIGAGRDADPMSEDLSPGSLERLGLTIESVDRLCESAAQQLDTVLSRFQG